MHLIYTGQAPSYLTDIVIQTATVGSRSRFQSASSLQYEQPRARLKLGQRVFSYAAPAIGYMEHSSNVVVAILTPKLLNVT